jgi:prophage maintenance system killer protein/prophage antirepressor-like protein
MKNSKNEIVLFQNQNVKLEVTFRNETVWLTQAQMADLFGRDVKTISKHILNAFKEELDEKSNSQKRRIANSDKLVNIYNLDVIISVGYRVKSKNGIIFRKWANKIIKDYLIKGYAINEKRLKDLEKTVKLIDIASRINTEDNDAKELINVINKYSKALNLLEDYDHKKIEKPKGTIDERIITYDNCLDIINALKENNSSNIFGIEKDDGLKSIINDIYQTFDGKDLYHSLEEKASNLFYLIIKNHIFIDGNKRIGATLFIYFLNYYGLLYKNGIQIINNNMLVALTLLVAESNPKEKETLIDLLINFLNNNN